MKPVGLSSCRSRRGSPRGARPCHPEKLRPRRATRDLQWRAVEDPSDLQAETGARVAAVPSKSHALPTGVPEVRPVAHRHVVLTIPRLPRPLFRRRRELLGELARAGAEAVKELVRHASGEGDARPGMVVSVATAGDPPQWHPQLHLITTDAGRTPEGTWHLLPQWDSVRLMTLFREGLLGSLLDNIPCPSSSTSWTRSRATRRPASPRSPSAPRRDRPRRCRSSARPWPCLRVERVAATCLGRRSP